MNQDYQQAREVMRLYADFGDSQRKIEVLTTRISASEAEVRAPLALSQENLEQLQRARASVWI